MKLTYIYFDFPFWRAEAGRISLYIGDIPFQDLKITSDEFQRVKLSGKLDNGIKIPFHQLPCLIIDKFTLAQTSAISRYCGKLSGLYPKDNHLLAAKIDQYIDLATDITVIISKTFTENDDAKRKVLRKKVFEDELIRKFKMLEKSIDTSNKWIVGKSMTIADISIWRLLGWLSSGSIEWLPTNFIKDYPKVQKICKRVDGHQKIIDWIEKTYPKGYKRGNY